MTRNDDDDCQNNEAVGKAITKKKINMMYLSCVYYI